jgi:hypothetical protein
MVSMSEMMRVAARFVERERGVFLNDSNGMTGKYVRGISDRGDEKI